MEFSKSLRATAISKELSALPCLVQTIFDADIISIWIFVQNMKPEDCCCHVVLQ